MTGSTTVINVIEIGSKVFVGPDDTVTGEVLAVKLSGPRGASIEYEVVWWCGRTRNTEWVAACEVRPQVEQATDIGFRGRIQTSN
jgi:Ethanolamine utilization protein EutJ (predicted chaperonin)